MIAADRKNNQLVLDGQKREVRKPFGRGGKRKDSAPALFGLSRAPTLRESTLRPAFRPFSGAKGSLRSDRVAIAVAASCGESN